MSNTGDVPYRRERMVSEISFRDASAKEIDTQFTVLSTVVNRMLKSCLCFVHSCYCKSNLRCSYQKFK
jgi:hypothetical protein